MSPLPFRRPARPAPPPPARAGACANCDTPLSGRYCSRCGQDSDADGKPLQRALAEDVSDLFSLDSRIPRTLRTLMVPGRLTAEYLSGKRVPFVRPLRLALSATLALFLALAARAPDAPAITQDTTLAQDIGVVATRYPDRFAIAVLVMLPVLALLLRVAFRRAERPFAEHLVFALHFHAFACIAALLATLASFALPGVESFSNLALVGGAVSWVYLLFAMRRFYRAGWGRTVVGWVFVVGAYAFLVFLAFALVAIPLLF